MDCNKVERGLDYNPVFWDHKEKLVLDNWEKNKNFLIIGPKYLPKDTNEGIHFECPKVMDPTNAWLEFVEDTDGRIQMDGKLRTTPWVDENNITQKKTWSLDSFCVVYTNSEMINDTSEDRYSKFNFSFMTCKEIRQSWCETFTSTFHITCLITSTIFLITTLMVYVLDNSLRRTNPLFSKITTSFILNLIIYFIVLIDNKRRSHEKDRLNTMPCIISGYMVQYFFLGFSFWINAMSFNIWLKFRRMNRQSPSKEEANRTFWKYFTYAQGTPTLVIIFTAIIDSTTEEETNDENLLHYPNMGKYVCALGALTTPDLHQNFFGRPEFIYLKSFITALQLSNIVFLGITIKSLHAGWRNQTELQRITGKYDIIIQLNVYFL